MNVELLKKVATRLRRLRHKRHFDMNDYIYKTECGTAACIAGHALLLNSYRLVVTDDTDEVVSPTGRRVDPDKAARRLLGLTEAQADRLFGASQWPVEFGGCNFMDWESSSDARKYNNPKVAAARIDHFVKTKGKE